MKKIIILIFFFPFLTQAQLFTGGLHLGLVGAQIDGDQMWGYHHLGIMAGGFVDVNFKLNRYLELGLQYAGKGATQSLKYVGNGYSRTKVSLHYIDVPLILGYILNQKYDLQFGVLNSYLFKTRVIDASGNITTNDLSHYKLYDAEAIVGMYYIWRENFRVGLHLSYSIGFISRNPNQRNNFLILSVKYYLGK